jgi:hypothetical protein
MGEWKSAMGEWKSPTLSLLPTALSSVLHPMQCLRIALRCPQHDLAHMRYNVLGEVLRGEALEIDDVHVVISESPAKS